MSRIFIFKEAREGGGYGTRPTVWAIPEDKITEVTTVWGSHNVYLKVNGHSVEGSFDKLVELLAMTPSHARWEDGRINFK